MNKTLAWVLVALVVVAGGYYTLKGSKSSPTDEGTVVIDENAGKKMAFSQFVKQGGSYKCDVKQYMSDMDNSGTVYMSGENMRGEFSTIAEGRTMDTSFISKDGFMYTWSSSMPGAGFKMQVDPKEVNADGNTSGTYSWNTNEIGDYNCEPWTADSSKFELPAGVTFRDLESK